MNFALAAALCAIIYGLVSIKWIIKQPAGNDRMQEIARAIQEGASAYMNRQYGTIVPGEVPGSDGNPIAGRDRDGDILEQHLVGLGHSHTGQVDADHGPDATAPRGDWCRTPVATGGT